MVTSSYPRFPGDIAGTFVASLAGALEELGHAVTVVAPADPAVTSDHGGFPRATHFSYSPFRRLQPMGYGKALENDQRLRLGAYACAPTYLLAGAFGALRASRQGGCDLVHAHWVLPSGPVGLLASWVLRRPLVITLHGSDVYLAKRSRPLGWLAGRSLARAGAITACSPDLAQDALILGASAQRVHLLPWGADPGRFGAGNGRRWRARLGIPEGHPVVLGVGRLVEKKGFRYLLYAFSRVRKAHPDAVLVLGGEGPLQGEMEPLGRELGLGESTRWCGRVPWEDMPDFLAMADVVAVPSVRDASGNQDGLPTVVLEAMAAGKPVIASNLAGIPLAIRHGSTGLLVPPGDPEALAEALTMLLDNPERAQALGNAAQQRVREELNWRAIAARYVEVYREALRGRACVS